VKINRLVNLSLLLLTLTSSWYVFATTDPFTVTNNYSGAPTDNLRLMVTQAWEFMYPSYGTAPDYKKAYELNEKAWSLGHPEGASNIGLIYEKGLGVEKDDAAALKWYSLALSSPYHSPQAEIGMVRIILKRTPNQVRLELADKYIKAALDNAMDPKTLWYEERSGFLKEIGILENQLDSLKWQN